jgi:tetratricopeptide (TPR) repeat protein
MQKLLDLFSRLSQRDYLILSLIAIFFIWDWLSKLEKPLRLMVLWFPKRAEAHFNLGCFLFDKVGKQDEAEKEFRQAIALNPRFLNAYFSLFSVLSSRDKWDDDLNDFCGQIFNRFPDDPMVILFLGIWNWKKGHLPEAEEAFRKAISLAPMLDLPYILLSMMLRDNGRILEAEQVFAATKKIFPAIPSLKYDLEASFFYKKGDHPKAIAIYNKTIRLDPKNTSVICLRGRSYLAIKNYPDALVDFSTVINLQPDWTKGYYYRGILYIELKNFQAALVDFTKIIQLDPQHSEGYNNRGNIYCVLENYPAALADYDKAIQLDPQDTIAYINRGRTNRASKNFQAALMDFTKGIQLNPQISEYYITRGLTFQDLNNFKAAHEDYLIAMELDPHDSIPVFNIACLNAVQGNVNEACTWLKLAIEMDKNNIEDAINDHDFDLIRNTKEFQEIVSEFNK